MINNSHRLALSLGITALLVAGLFMLLGMTARTAGADAGTLFVTPLGSGTACTQAQPCALQTALTQATDGDTLYLAGGAYIGAGDARRPGPYGRLDRQCASGGCAAALSAARQITHLRALCAK
jgi:hypothetical protein